MKKYIFFGILAMSIFLPIVISEGQVMPACSIIEEKVTNVDNLTKSVDKELEDYVIGVVAGEMPYNFPHEALNAQAVAARTYAVRQIRANPNIKYKDIAQAYISVDIMKKRWGKNFETNYNKIKYDVYATAGEILEYNNEPILATFCSTTNGYTEECQNVWTQDLKSVKSDGDELSPYFNDRVSVTKDSFAKIFGGSNPVISEKTKAGYVKAVKVGEKSYTGNEIRKTFGLKSTSFTISTDKNNIVFSTKGYGHGVGMSQYGAKGMAEAGYDFKDILNFYYTGIEIK